MGVSGLPVIHALLEAVSLVLIIGFTAFVTIGIYWATSPDHDREAERRQMREGRRRPAKEKEKR